METKRYAIGSQTRGPDQPSSCSMHFAKKRPLPGYYFAQTSCSFSSNLKKACKLAQSEAMHLVLQSKAIHSANGCEKCNELTYINAFLSGRDCF
jgi:hypothetical protein